MGALFDTPATQKRGGFHYRFCAEVGSPRNVLTFVAINQRMMQSLSTPSSLRFCGAEWVTVKANPFNFLICTLGRVINNDLLLHTLDF